MLKEISSKLPLYSRLKVNFYQISLFRHPFLFAGIMITRGKNMFFIPCLGN